MLLCAHQQEGQHLSMLTSESLLVRVYVYECTQAEPVPNHKGPQTFSE